MQKLYPPGRTGIICYTKKLGSELEMLPTTDREEAAFAEFNRIKDMLDNIEISCYVLFPFKNPAPVIAVNYIKEDGKVDMLAVSKDEFDIREAWNMIKHCYENYDESLLSHLDKLNQSYLTRYSDGLYVYVDGKLAK